MEYCITDPTNSAMGPSQPSRCSSPSCSLQTWLPWDSCSFLQSGHIAISVILWSLSSFFILSIFKMHFCYLHNVSELSFQLTKQPTNSRILLFSFWCIYLLSYQLTACSDFEKNFKAKLHDAIVTYPSIFCPRG